MLENLLTLVLGCLGAAVAEEVIFRAGGMALFSRLFGNVSHALLKAALLSSFIFSVLHVTGVWSAVISGSSQSMLLAVQALLKFTQAFEFGICMCALYLWKRSIAWPIGAHLVFDLIYFAPSVLRTGCFPSTYLTGDISDLVVLVLTIALLLSPCAKSLKWLRQEVLSCTAPK